MLVHSSRNLADILTIALHIDDAASAFILLVEEALKANGGNAQWGSKGYYFAEAQEFVRPIQQRLIKTQFANDIIEMGGCFRRDSEDSIRTRNHQKWGCRQAHGGASLSPAPLGSAPLGWQLQGSI